MKTVKPRSKASTLALAAVLGAASFPGQAAIVEYQLNLTDKHNGAIGSGAFIWNSDSEIMTSLNWTINGHSGSVLDSALASTYRSYDPLANTYGELFYRYFTAPQAFLVAELGLTGHSVGMMPYNVSSDFFGFVGFGAEKTSSAGTYLFYDKNWSVNTEGYLTATVVPVPAAVWLFGGALTGWLGFSRRRAVIATSEG
ncbi:VPLPA-CTERM sorting domain-containing protein [Methylomonas sp. UP202]|uniref:VPLPA-CTERM sorting domain-containing protein n=1 Tax=Methylomonas sp. UP202 TaxID=3040943 RepID=UPI002479773B|nr:VPLPA-CTERM sorting domain-containing protein [Methylomonas sp. UP202]WGS87363.1 VPLPA-CTERM sorting domain-containing protein [Methylomonas sp. UP202]